MRERKLSSDPNSSLWSMSLDSGKGLAYRPVSLCSLAGRYDNPMPESTMYIPPSQGLRIWLQDSGNTENNCRKGLFTGCFLVADVFGLCSKYFVTLPYPLYPNSPSSTSLIVSIIHYPPLWPYQFPVIRRMSHGGHFDITQVWACPENKYYV